jgi:hypothetical protein
MFPFPTFMPAASGFSFPTVQSSATTTSGNIEILTANLPSGIVAGDLLLLFVSISDSSARTVSTPAGWTQMYYATGSSPVRKLAGYYKVASGAEGSTVDITASNPVSWGCVALRIDKDSYTGTPEAGTVATGSSVNPDPPSLSPSWGSNNALWLAIAGTGTTSTTTATDPTNYADQLRAQVTTGLDNNGPADLIVAQREYLSDTDDPGTFTIGASAGWAAQTVAIQGV